MRDAAGELADDMTERAKGFAESSIGGLAGQVSAIAQGLNDTADELRDQKSTLASELTRSAASGLERVASHLETNDLRSLAREVEDFARARPALFIGGAIALGFVLGRFLRASSEGRYDGGGSVRYSGEGDRYASTSGYRERYERDYGSGAEYDRGMTGRTTAASPGSRRSTPGTDYAGDRNAR